MQQITTKAIAKVAAVATGLAMTASMLSLAPMAHAAALTDAQVQSILSLLTSFGADSTTIANVQASLTGGTPTGGGGSSPSCSFTRDLKTGVSGDDVTCLQRALLAGGYAIPALSSGSASFGYYGSQTVHAVAAWQAANNVAPAVGYFGSISRAHWNLGGGSNNGGAGTGTGLKVSLSATSPNGSVLVQGQAIGDLGDFVFANPTSAPINVTSLTFNRIGVSNDSTLTNIYLYTGGMRLTDSVGISSSQFVFNSPSPLFTVPAGGTYTVSVRSDIADSTSGQQIGVSLVSVASSGALDSSVHFPVMSGYQTISAANLASVVYTNSSATPSSAVTVSAQNDYPLWQDTVSVSTNPVKLTSMRFTNLGSADSSAITNLRLYVDGVQVGNALTTMGGDRTATFDLSANPVTLSTSSHVIKVLANITNSAANRTIVMSVQRASDGMFVDSQLNQPVTPHVTNTTTNFSTVSTGTITIQSAAAGVSVSRNPGSPSQSIAAGASNVKLASFDMLASGENVKVMDLYVYIATSTPYPGDTISNGKIMVNGVQVGSTKNVGTTVGTRTDFSLGSSLILPAGQTTVVDVYADAKATTGGNLLNNDTMTVYLDAATNNAQGISSLQTTSVPAAQVVGNSVTVSSSSLTGNKYSGYGNQTVIAGANNAKIGAFTLSTGATEGVTVNTIGVSIAGNSWASITNLTLKDDATGNTLGTIITTPSSGTNSFPVNLSIPVSSTKTISIYANVLSSAPNGSIVTTVTTDTTGTGNSTGQTTTLGGTVQLQTITVGAGTLSVTRGAGDPVSNNILAGASQVMVGQFNFAAQNSPYTVQNLAILVPNGQASAVTNVTLSYKDSNGATQTVTQPLTVSSTMPNATATFTGLTMYVPNNDSANLDVYIGTPSIANAGSNISGVGVNVSLDLGHGSNVFRAISSSGAAVSTPVGANVSSNGTFYVRKSIPTFAMINTGLTVPATGSPIYKFSITADPAGAIEWTKLTFNIATTSATVSNVYLTDDSSGTNLLDNNTTSASTTATTITVDLTKNATQAKYQQVAAGATKTYNLYGTVTGFTTGSTVTISLASDSSHIANEAATTGTGNVEWSDRSASSHTISSTDWTNGYLLKNFTSNAISYSK